MSTKNRPAEQVKEKTTFNISTKTKDSLDVCWFKLKRELKGRKTGNTQMACSVL